MTIRDAKKPGGDHYLVYLNRTCNLGGAQLLRMAERYVAERLGGGRLTLQDQSFISCNGNSDSVAAGDFDLGFRSLLSHGQTWYEIRGYAATSGITPEARRAVTVAVRTFAQLEVAPLLEAVRRQLRLLVEKHPYACADGSMFSAALPLQTTVDAPFPAVLRARRVLLALLQSAPKGARLGEWLLGLPCREYAAFMRAMYGTRHNARPVVALTAVDGVRTPTLAEFKRANRLHRMMHRIVFSKTV